MKIITLMILTLGMTACSSSGKVTTSTTYGVNGNRVITETVGSSKDHAMLRKTEADIAIANATKECWESQKSATLQTSEPIPSGLSPVEFAMVTMATALVESNKALAAAGKPDITPCQNIGTNSNDVAVAKERGKTERSANRWKAAPLLAGAYIGKAAIDSFSNLAAAGINAAGNRTTINGHGNNANTTSQDADNASTISDSGNYDEAGGIKTNPADVTLTAANDNSPEALCEGVYRPATEQEITDGFAVDGFVCSDNDGGYL